MFEGRLEFSRTFKGPSQHALRRPVPGILPQCFPAGGHHFGIPTAELVQGRSIQRRHRISWIQLRSLGQPAFGFVVPPLSHLDQSLDPDGGRILRSRLDHLFDQFPRLGIATGIEQLDRSGERRIDPDGG